MLKPILSIIIISYNTKDTTINCLESVFLDKILKTIPYEIIVIDNHSGDQSVEAIKKLFLSKHFDQFKVIENKSNFGFGKANNQGIKIASGEYLLLLNSDTIILHSAISQSLDWLSSHPESYGCTAQLLNQNKTIQASGGYFPNLLNTFSWLLHLDDLPFVNFLIKPFHPHPPQFYLHEKFFYHDHPQDWITGAFMLLRKNTIDNIGCFDENFFMYGEEMEMCYRHRQQYPDLKMWYLVGPQVIHLGGASADNKTQVLLREYQGIISFYSKHYPQYLFIVKLLIKFNKFVGHFL